MQSFGETTCATSLLSEALSSELAHTTAVINGVLGLFKGDWGMSVEECDALMSDIGKITSRMRQLSRLIVFKCEKDHNARVRKQIEADRRKLALEEAQGIIMREAERILQYTPPELIGHDWPHPLSAT